jgi:trimeric autotransporter adhesin
MLAALALACGCGDDLRGDGGDDGGGAQDGSGDDGVGDDGGGGDGGGDDGGGDGSTVLAGLVVSRGELVPAFDPDVTEYTLSLPLGAEWLVVTPTAEAPAGTTIEIAGSAVASGAASPPIDLDPGDNLIELVMSAASGASQTYAITATCGGAILQDAYLKASNTEQGQGEAGDGFGWSVAVDGDTLVVGAIAEDSGATGVDGDQGDSSQEEAGAAYVFVRDGTGWSQQAYLKASNTDTFDLFGSRVAISGDTIAVSAPQEEGFEDVGEGAVYIFVREGTSWSQQAHLKASNAEFDRFGQSLALDGDTLAVGAPQEDSAATGIDGNQADNSAAGSGAVYLFERDGASWSQAAYVKASNTGAGDLFGWSVALDGDTLAVGARDEQSAATGVGGDQSDDSVLQAGAVYVFARSEASWSQQAYVKASNTDARDNFGTSVAVDGDTLAVSATWEDSGATGVNGDQTDESAARAGAVYVFTRSGTTWSQEAYVKPSNTESDDTFGEAVALSGGALAVSSPRESSNAVGIDGDQANNSAVQSGAVYLFARAEGGWSQRAYVKASNTDPDGVPADYFGEALALDGDRLVAGAYGEDSIATGVDGDQSDNSGISAGAVYVFGREEAPPPGLLIDR